MSDFWEVLISFAVMAVLAGSEYWLKKRKERQEHDEYWAKKSRRRRENAERNSQRASRSAPVTPDFFEPGPPAEKAFPPRNGSLPETGWETSAWMEEEEETPAVLPSTEGNVSVPNTAAAVETIPAAPMSSPPRPGKAEIPHPYVTLLRRNSRTAVVMMEILSPPKALRKQ